MVKTWQTRLPLALISSRSLKSLTERTEPRESGLMKKTRKRVMVRSKLQMRRRLDQQRGDKLIFLEMKSHPRRREVREKCLTLTRKKLLQDRPRDLMPKSLRIS